MFKPWSTFSMVLLATTSTLAAAQPKFVGSYHQRTVDSVAALYLLPDQTFCYTAIAGALDLTIPGTWQSQAGAAGKHTLTLTQTSTFPSRFVVILGDAPKNDPDKPKPGQRQIILNGAALSMLQRDMVMGWGNSTRLPDNLAPLFAADQSMFQRRYTLPLPTNARYLFLGYPDRQGAYQVSRFDIASKTDNSVFVNYSIEAAGVGKQWPAVFDGTRLNMEGNDMGAPEALEQEMIQKVRRNCLSNQTSDGRQVHILAPQDERRIERLLRGKPWFDYEDPAEDQAAIEQAREAASMAAPP